MTDADYVYTVGMTDAKVDEYLQTGDHGVLALADGDDAYAVPISYHYDGDRLLVRISETGAGTKDDYVAATETATLVRYESDGEDAWSVVVRGPLERWAGDVDGATLDELFPPFHLFDESAEDVAYALYELEPASVVGRRRMD